MHGRQEYCASLSEQELEQFDVRLVEWHKKVLEEEKQLVGELRRLANRTGVSLPSNPAIGSCFFESIGMLDNSGDIATLFFAQHQGYATRLLDWTEFHQYAAYFATFPNLQRTEDVWNKSYDRERFSVTIAAPPIDDDGREIHPLLPGVYLYRELPRLVNRRAVAQNGVMTYHGCGSAGHQFMLTEAEAKKNVCTPQGIGRIAKVLDAAIKNRSLFILNLTCTDRLGVAMSLQASGITGVTVYPDESGMVRNIYESQWIQRMKENVGIGK